jgi:molybdate transport system substrate-binding protein
MSRYLVLLLALAVGGCGGDAAGSKPDLVVSAAASLTEALTACGSDFEGAEVRLSFAGSDELAAQIRQGVEPDVYAAANAKLPEELAAEGLVEEPEVFATNSLVLAGRADGDIASLDDLTGSDVTIAMGSETVPIGSYTRDVLSRLGDEQSDAILANVRSNEPDVKGIVGKLTQGAVDAGFVYRTDVEATGGDLKAIELPEELQPAVAYGVAVVDGAEQPELAREYIAGLTDGPCADALAEAGFGPPPQ